MGVEIQGWSELKLQKPSKGGRVPLCIISLNDGTFLIYFYMTIAKQKASYICTSCLRRRPGLTGSFLHYGRVHGYATQSPSSPQEEGEGAVPKDADGQEEEPGRMSQRLSQMTEESFEVDGRGIKKAIEEGGFSEELRRKLEARIQDSTFKSRNPAGFAEINMPVGLKI